MKDRLARERDALVEKRFAEAAALSEGVVPWQEAGNHVGEKSSVVGKVVATKDIGKVTYLDFDNRRGSFSAVVFHENYGKFPAPPERLFLGKLVKATGVITQFKGKPRIVIDDPSQIEILSPSGEDEPSESGQELNVEFGHVAVQLRSRTEFATFFRPSRDC